MADSNNSLILNASQARKSSYTSAITSSAPLLQQLPIVDIFVLSDVPMGGDIGYYIPPSQFASWLGRRITIAKTQDTTSTGNQITITLPAGEVFNTTGFNSIDLLNEPATTELIFSSIPGTPVAVVSPASTAGGGVTVANLGAGEDVLANPGSGAGPFNFKSLVAGANINLTPSADEIEIEAIVPPSSVELANLGLGEEILANPGTGAGPFNFKSLVAGSNITLTPTANDVTIASTSTAEAKGLFCVAKSGSQTAVGSTSNAITSFATTYSTNFIDADASYSLNTATGELTINTTGNYNMSFSFQITRTGGTDFVGQFQISLYDVTAAGYVTPAVWMPVETLPDTETTQMVASSCIRLLAGHDYLLGYVNNAQDLNIVADRHSTWSLSLINTV